MKICGSTKLIAGSLAPPAGSHKLQLRSSRKGNEPLLQSSLNKATDIRFAGGGVVRVVYFGGFAQEECLIVGCLALNASFEPLTMVPLRRALRLVIDGKAEIVEADSDRVVRSERLTLPRPAVIRLMRFIHVPRRFRRQVTNTFLFARDRYRCQYCGRLQIELKPRESLTRDHLIPLSRGGRTSKKNIVVSCKQCNSLKKNLTVAELRFNEQAITD